MNADEFNKLFPVGMPVVAYPGVRPEDDRNAPRLVTKTRSEAQLFCGHTDVVWVEGHGACIALTHIDPIDLDRDHVDTVGVVWRHIGQHTVDGQPLMRDLDPADAESAVAVPLNEVWQQHGPLIPLPEKETE